MKGKVLNPKQLEVEPSGSLVIGTKKRIVVKLRGGTAAMRGGSRSSRARSKGRSRTRR